MGAMGSGIVQGGNAVQQFRQQQQLSQLLGSKGQMGSPTAPTMSGPMQGPQAPQGGISLQNLLMSKARSMTNPMMSLFGTGPE